RADPRDRREPLPRALRERAGAGGCAGRGARRVGAVGRDAGSRAEPGVRAQARGGLARARPRRRLDGRRAHRLHRRALARDPRARTVSAIDALMRAQLGVGIERALPIFVLLSLRALPLAFVAPWLGWKGTATYARASVAIAIALGLTPLALRTAPELPASGLALALLGVREVLIGAAVAIAGSLQLRVPWLTREIVVRCWGSAS